MKIIDIDCKGCSNSCPLTVLAEGTEVIEVKGNCCHRGIISAKTQLKPPSPSASADNNTPIQITCSGCSNRCYLKVYMKDGKVDAVKGSGCRRGEFSAKKQLERD